MKNISRLNLVGSQVKRLRMLRGWTQGLLSEKLGVAGWSVSRAPLAKLEARMLRVGDHHLFYLAKVFEVPIKELFPKIDPQDPNLQETINRLMCEEPWESKG